MPRPTSPYCGTHEVCCWKAAECPLRRRKADAGPGALVFSGSPEHLHYGGGVGDSPVFPAASRAQLSWTLNAYKIVYAALLVPGGRLADRPGRRQVFLGGPEPPVEPCSEALQTTGGGHRCWRVPRARTLRLHLGVDLRAHEGEETGIVRIGDVDADRRLVSHPVQRKDRTRRHEDPGIGRPRRQRHIVEPLGKRAP